MAVFEVWGEKETAEPSDPARPRSWVKVNKSEMPERAMRDDAWAFFRRENPAKKSASYPSGFTDASGVEVLYQDPMAA